MLEVRDDIKTVVKGLCRNLSDLSRELQMNYDSLNHYLNGRRPMPQDVSEKIMKVLSNWENGL